MKNIYIYREREGLEVY